MKPIFSLLNKNKKTTKDFSIWLYNKLNKNKNKYNSFNKYPTTFKLPYLKQYLEYKGVNILEALCYYDAKSSNRASNIIELEYYMIVEEFKRIEQNKKINYVPF